MTTCFNCLYDFEKSALYTKRAHETFPIMSQGLDIPSEQQKHGSGKAMDIHAIYDDLDEPDSLDINDMPAIASSLNITRDISDASDTTGILQKQKAKFPTYLLHMESDAVEANVFVPEAGLVVGRDGACDVVLHDKTVSAQHVSVTPLRAGLLVEDQGATNFALYKGFPIQEGVIVAVGESFVVGRTLFEVVVRPKEEE